MDGTTLPQSYYQSIDQDNYETLASILAESFVHYRPDRTLTGRERFLTFIREERPIQDTSHVIDTLYRASSATPDDSSPTRIAAEGHLVRPDDTIWFGFVDTFQIAESAIQAIQTYIDRPSD